MHENVANFHVKKIINFGITDMIKGQQYLTINRPSLTLLNMSIQSALIG